jgi:phage/conjugal plasmid C-4 type zinc finger TraR family protein
MRRMAASLAAKREAGMAGGWAQDGAVSEQIEASINDELARMKAKARPTGTSLTHCAECEEPIPEARRQALPGVKLCIDCQRARDGRPEARGGINRRGSKDSQMK